MCNPRNERGGNRWWTNLVVVMEEKWLKNLVRMIEQFVQGCGTEEVEYEGGREGEGHLLHNGSVSGG